MRKNRKKYSELDPEERLRVKCRSYTNVLIARGKLIRQGCRVCGGPAQAHHHDYAKPWEVDWLCRAHHNEEHARLKAEPET